MFYNASPGWFRSPELCDQRYDVGVPHRSCVVQDKPMVDLSGMRSLQYGVFCQLCVHRRMCARLQPLPCHSVYAGPCGFRGEPSLGCTDQGYDEFAGTFSAAKRCRAMLHLRAIPRPAAVAHVSRGSLGGPGAFVRANCTNIFVGRSGSPF